MSVYMLGWVGGCGGCANCGPDDPCGPVAPVVTSAGLWNVTGCLAGSYAITASNSPTSFGASGLPSGLSVNTATGIISGRVRTSFSGTITVSATNACGTGTKNVSLTISAPSVPSPTLVCDSIIASMSKAGFQAFDGSFVWFLISTLSNVTSYLHQAIVNPGNGACNLPETHSDEYRYSGTETYDPATNTYSGSRGADRYTNGVFNNHISLPTDDICSVMATEVVCGNPVTKCNCTVVVPTVKDVVGDNICYGPNPDHRSTGTGRDSLGTEYTTAMLEANTIAALPSSYPGTFTGGCSAYINLDVDEVTCTVARFKYKFILPDLTGFDCYKLTWMEGSTPKSYLWNGTDTETPVYGPVFNPSSPGAIGITSIVATCDCS